MQIAIGIVLILAAIFLVVAVLMQSGKSHNLSGTIAGGAETFFGKSKASTMDKKLSKLTTIVAVVFVVLVLVAYLTQGVGKKTTLNTSGVAANTETTADTTADTTAETTGETTADTTADTEAAAEYLISTNPPFSVLMQNPSLSYSSSTPTILFLPSTGA